MRLNLVFDSISCVYPDYSFPISGKGQKIKSALKYPSGAPKHKKVKFLARQSKYYCEDRAAVLPTSAISTKETAIEVVLIDEPMVEPSKVPSPTFIKVY